jgi:hypothetical protein
LSGRKDFVKAFGEKDPMLGWNGIDICAKLRPSDKEIEVSNSDAHINLQFTDIY